MCSGSRDRGSEGPPLSGVIAVLTEITPLSGGPWSRGHGSPLHIRHHGQCGGAAAQRKRLAPAPVRTIAAPGAGKGAITPDGQDVVAAAGSGAVVINVNEAIGG